jgi:hypothetical protein
MAENDSVRNAEPIKRALDQFSLRVGRPNDVPRPVAVAKAGTVEYDNPEVLGSEINQTAGLEILDHAAIAMQKNQRFARTALDVVKSNAAHLEEATGRRIVMLRFVRKMTID